MENVKAAYKDLENKLRREAELYGNRIVELQARIEDLQEQLTSIRVVHDIEEHMNPAKKQLTTTIIQKPSFEGVDNEEYNRLLAKYRALEETNIQNKDLSQKEFNLRVELEKQIRVMREQIETERMLRSGIEQEMSNLKEKLKVADNTIKDLEQAIDQLKQGSGEVVFESGTDFVFGEHDHDHDHEHPEDEEEEEPRTPRKSGESPFVTSRKYLLRRRSNVCDILGCKKITPSVHHASHLTPTNVVKKRKTDKTTKPNTEDPKKRKT